MNQKSVVKYGVAVFALILLCIILPIKAQATAGVKISKVNFPDNTLRKIVKAYDKNKNNRLESKEIKKIQCIGKSREKMYNERSGYEVDDVSADSLDDLLASEYIRNLKGIQYLTSLKVLNVYGLNMKKLNLSKNKKLEFVRVLSYVTYFAAGEDGVKLKSINVRNLKKLRVLDVRKHDLKNINLESNKNLRVLYCPDNGLKSINLSKNKKLIFLNCENNRIKHIFVSKDICHNLKLLVISKNQFKNISSWLKKLTELKYLYCDNNMVTSLDLTNNKKLEGICICSPKLKEIKLGKKPKLKDLRIDAKNLVSALNLIYLDSLKRVIIDNVGKVSIRSCKKLETVYVDNAGTVIMKKLPKCSGYWLEKVSTIEIIDFMDGPWITLSGFKKATIKNSKHIERLEVKNGDTLLISNVPQLEEIHLEKGTYDSDWWTNIDLKDSFEQEVKKSNLKMLKIDKKVFQG